METRVPVPSTEGRYLAWLLRLWREGENGAWHASLQAIDGAEPVGFADLEQLFGHLLVLTGTSIEQAKLSQPNGPP